MVQDTVEESQRKAKQACKEIKEEPKIQKTPENCRNEGVFCIFLCSLPNNLLAWKLRLYISENSCKIRLMLTHIAIFMQEEWYEYF